MKSRLFVEPLLAVYLIIGLSQLAIAQSKRPPDQANFDWPRFLGVNVDGVAPETDLKLDWTVAPKLLWALPVGEGYGMGSIVDGNYYHFDAASSGERLRCIDLLTGRTQWTQSQKLSYQDMYGYESGPRSTATIDGEQIYTMGVGGQLTCRNKSDGELTWTVDTSGDYGVVQNFFGVGGSPLVVDDMVIVMVGGSPQKDDQIAPGALDRVSPNGSALVAFDRNTGRERWKCGEDLASYSSPRLMKVGAESLVLMFCRDGLIAVDPSSGTQRWRFDHRAEILESVNAMVPIISGDHVFISECYQVGSVLLKVTGKSAEVVWRDPNRDRRNQAMRVHWSTPVLVDGFIYGCSGRNAPDSDFRCIEMMTGKVQWTDPRRIRASVTRVGDHLLVLEERGEFQVIKPNANELEIIAQWRLDQATDKRPSIEYPCWAAPIMVGDKLLLRGDQRVLCLQIATKS